MTAGLFEWLRYARLVPSDSFRTIKGSFKGLRAIQMNAV